MKSAHCSFLPVDVAARTRREDGRGAIPMWDRHSPPRDRISTVSGTVHEGRKLPVLNQKATHAALGPVPNDATFEAMDLDALAHQGGTEEGGDICTLNHLIGAVFAANLSAEVAR